MIFIPRCRKLYPRLLSFCVWAKYIFDFLDLFKKTLAWENRRYFAMRPCHWFPPVITSVQPIRSTTALIPLRSFHWEIVSGDTKCRCFLRLWKNRCCVIDQLNQFLNLEFIVFLYLLHTMISTLLILAVCKTHVIHEPCIWPSSPGVSTWLSCESIWLVYGRA